MFKPVQIISTLSVCFLFLVQPLLVFSQEIESVEFQSNSDLSVLYHEKTSSLLVDLYSLNHEFTAKLNSGNSQFSICWETDKQLYRYKTSKNNLDMKIGTDQNTVSLQWKFRYTDFYIEPGTSVSFSGFGTRFGFGSELGWEPNDLNRLSISFFNRKKSFFHEWNVKDSQAEFNQWSDIRDIKFSVNCSPFKEITIKSEIRKQFYSVESESEPFSESSKYTNLSYSVGLDFKPMQTLKSWVIFSDFSGRGEPDFRFQKFSFSSISNGKTTDRKFSAGILYDMQGAWEIGTVFNYRKLDLSSSGLLQSFPFTAGVISILGDYYFFSIDGTVATYDLLFAGIRHYSNEKSLTIKVGYQLMEPDLFLQTWEPLFFTVGRKNEKTTQLDFSRLHVIPLTIGWKFKVNSFSVDLLLNQLIPVYAEKRVTTPISGKNPNGASSGSSAPQSDRFIWGGTNFKITVGYEI